MFDWLVLPLAIGLGFCFLWIFVKIFTAGDAGQGAAEYRSQYETEYAARNQELIDLQWQLKAYPQNQVMLSMYADRQENFEQWELDNGINPYKTEKPITKRSRSAYVRE